MGWPTVSGLITKGRNTGRTFLRRNINMPVKKKAAKKKAKKH
jgi:hypothetical protein